MKQLKEELSASYKNWPASKVHMVQIHTLKPYELNARLHSDFQIEQIANSMTEFGWTMPILASKDGTIIAGHGRLEAAKKLNYTECPVMYADNWSDVQKRAYVIADNQLALNASWNYDVLKTELKAIEGDFDLTLTGFSDADLAQLLNGSSDFDPIEEWKGMPEFETEARSYRSIMVHIANSDDWEDFAAKMAQPISEKAKYIWYPYKSNEDLKSKSWESE